MSKFFSYQKIILLLVSATIFLSLFIFVKQLIPQVRAWIMPPSYISNLTVSPSPFDPSGDSDAADDDDIWNPPRMAEMTISYNQEVGGLVVVKAYPYYPDYFDPEYPDDPYTFIDFDHPINIFNSLAEPAGLNKIVTWAGLDQDENIAAEGDYLLEAAICADVNYSVCHPPETKLFNITYHLNQ